MTRTAIRAALWAALCLVQLGCDRDLSIVEMKVLPGPPGAAMLAMDLVALGEAQLLVAPTPQQLMVRDKDPWQAVDSQLLPTYQLAPFERLQSVLLDSPFPRSRSFCAADGRVWFLGKSDPQQPPQLWMSIDAGRTFNLVELPEPRAGQKAQEIRATDPYWLRCVDSDVYVMHSRDVWRYIADENVQWRALDLNGVDFEGGAELPPVIRSYLPRNEVRPFELLTLLSDQLYVWRRSDENTPWILTSTFSNAERDLIGSDNGTDLWLVTPTAIFQSDDQAEQWYRISPVELTSIESTHPFEADDGSTFLLVGSADGSIWKFNSTWTMTRPPDPDRRSVVSFVKRGDVIWAAVRGQGALRSADLGESWEDATEGAKNNLINDLDFTRTSLVVATSSGAYERSLSDTSEWTRLHNRAATSVHVLHNGHIIVGTRAGDLVTGPHAEPLTTTIQPNADSPVFELIDGQASMPPSAVVGIRSVGDFIVALTHRNGAAVSLDGGATWQPYEFAGALTSTLSSSTITRFLLGDEGKDMFLAERSARRGTPTQLWRSENNGTSWTALKGLGQDNEDNIWISWTENGRPPILIAQNNTLARSMDGDQWELLDGPWRSAQIVGMDIADNRAVLLAESGARHVIYYLDSIDNPRSVDRILVSWPPSEGIGNIRAIRLYQRRLYVLTDGALLEGTLPVGNRYTSSLASTVTAAIVVLATLIGFLILKRFG